MPHSVQQPSEVSLFCAKMLAEFSRLSKLTINPFPPFFCAESCSQDYEFDCWPLYSKCVSPFGGLRSQRKWPATCITSPPIQLRPRHRLRSCCALKANRRVLPSPG